MSRRSGGILLPVHALPSPFGIGDFGPAAYRFADFLSGTGQEYWQILPLNPTTTAHDNSPYMSISAFAVNPLFISPEFLVRDGLLDNACLADAPQFPAGAVDYAAVERYKNSLFDRAFAAFRHGAGDHEGFRRFVEAAAGWLPMFALFSALRIHYDGRPWTSWPEEIRQREEKAVSAMEEKLALRIRREQFLQYIVATQWDGLRAYCRKQGLRIIGDLPIYVDHDSADVWCNRELFRLDGEGRPVVVAGVPPDYFSATGQLWQNPLYDWEVHERTGFSWWLARLERALSMTDLVRIDHFRGLVAYWEVPAGAPDATGGRWVPAPGTALLEAAKARFPRMPFIAEDLGIITPDVRELMHRFSLPGMRVLLFAFTDELPENPHAPHNVPEDVFLYTGTHDNPPARGWYEACATDADRNRVLAYLGLNADAGTLPEILIRFALISQARAVIIPVQDLLGLGIEARTNTPGRPAGNWRWRLDEAMLTQDVAGRLAEMTRVCNRWRGSPGMPQE